MSVKLKKWKFVVGGTKVGKYNIEDDSIFTVDDGVMQYIVDLHNKTLAA